LTASAAARLASAAAAAAAAAAAVASELPSLAPDASKEPPLPPLTRPVRLFNVSAAKRNVGAMFTEDVGGGYFCQADLSERGCFVLDSGKNHKNYINHKRLIP
jgi:hypothetical protein